MGQWRGQGSHPRCLVNLWGGSRRGCHDETNNSSDVKLGQVEEKNSLYFNWGDSCLRGGCRLFPSRTVSPGRTGSQACHHSLQESLIAADWPRATLGVTSLMRRLFFDTLQKEVAGSKQESCRRPGDHSRILQSGSGFNQVGPTF